MEKEYIPPFPRQYLRPPGEEEKMDPAPRYHCPNYKGSEKLKDKVALITGGDSGIGRATAILFAREGAKVAITHLPTEEEDAQVCCEEIEKEGSEALSIEIDLTSKHVAEEISEKVIERFGKIDILVNNAAYQNHVEDIDELDFVQFQHTFDVNIFSYFKLVKAFLPHFQENSCIINTSSLLGYVGSENLIDYSATKGAVHAFTKSLAKSLAERKIRVNSVAPGPVWTPLNPAEREYEDFKDFGDSTLFGRPAQPDEIAPAYVFLAADTTGSYITGETINIFGTVNGGN